MARDLLTPPSSIVTSKADFSGGNRQLDERRSLLSPDILEYQICIQDWDDVKYQISHEVIEENYILEPFKTVDLLNDEENEGKN